MKSAFILFLIMIAMAESGKCQSKGDNLKSDSDTKATNTYDKYYSIENPKLKHSNEHFTLETECSKAEAIFIATYNPKATPPIKIKEYLKGKDSSASALALMEAQAQIHLNEKSDIIVGSYVVDGVLMGYKSLISNEEQIFKRCARF